MIASAPPVLQAWEFTRLRDVVYREAGIWLSDAKTALVASRLQRRVRELQLSSFGAYHRLVLRDPQEKQRLIECICTHETSFFREPRQWEFLEQQMFPAWRAAAARGERRTHLRAWSAGCATGEEPFSIAMSLLRHFPGWRVEVLATDVSERALQSARAAEWPLSRADQLPPSFQKEFMLRGDVNGEGRMRATPDLREVVRFARLNLNALEPGEAGAWDLIFCRNVLIYFDAASKKRVLESLQPRLAPGGLLLLGHAEAIGPTPGLRALMPTLYASEQP